MMILSPASYFFILQFDWKRYFNKLTEGLGDKSFSDSEPFWVMSAHYLRKLTSILSKFPRRWNIIPYVELFSEFEAIILSVRVYSNKRRPD